MAKRARGHRYSKLLLILRAPSSAAGVAAVHVANHAKHLASIAAEQAALTALATIGTKPVIIPLLLVGWVIGIWRRTCGGVVVLVLQRQRPVGGLGPAGHEARKKSSSGHPWYTMTGAYAKENVVTYLSTPSGKTCPGAIEITVPPAAQALVGIREGHTVTRNYRLDTTPVRGFDPFMV